MTTPEQSTHADVAAAFDSVASRYDEGFDRDPTTVRLRHELHSLIRSLARPGARILDIACGTGTDAIALSRDGFEVTGVDITGAMISQARMRSSGMTPKGPVFLEGSLADLPTLVSGRFDLMYSNFGGLNCISDLSPVASSVDRLLAPGGHFFAVMMPRISPWEIVSGLMRLRPAYAFRRIRGRAAASGFNQHTFPVFYHRLASLRRVLRADCDLIDARGWNIITPPPGSSVLRGQPSRFLRLLSALEVWLSSLPLVRSTGDHVLAVFRKRSVPV